MNPSQAARALAAFYRRFETSAPSGDLVERGPLSGAVVSGADSPYPSANPNRAWLHAEDLPDAASIRALDDAYRAAGVPRYFLALLPEEGSAAAATALLAHGFALFHGPEYMAFARPSAPLPVEAPGLAVRRLAPEETRAHAAEFIALQGGERTGGRFVRLAGIEGFEHFGVFDGQELVAAALSCRMGNACYLGFAATKQEHRGRGAQSALIAARVARAAELGASRCFCETLSIGGSSLRNLQRAGFEHLLSLRMLERRLSSAPHSG